MHKQTRVAALMAAAAFFTLAGYEFIRSPATVLFKNAYGAENLPLVMAAMPVVVFLGVALYGQILTALGPRRTLLVTSLGSALLILCCYLLVLTGSKTITPVLYLTKELYIVLLIEQYWSYINSTLTTASAKKLNGPITGIAGLGGVTGTYLAANFVPYLGTESMILLAAVSLIPAALVSNITYRIHGEPEIPPSTDQNKSHMGWHWFRENPVLAYLLAIVLISQLVAAVLDIKFQGLLSEEFVGQQDRETELQLQFWFWLNVSSLLLQFIVAPLLLSFVALRRIHILMPVVHAVAIGFAVVDPTVFSVGLAFFLFKVFDYSVFRAAKEVLYIPLGYDGRYRTKEIIDVIGYRTGKGASSVVIVMLQRAGVIMTNYYLVVGFIATLVWLALVFPLTRDAEATRE